VANPRIAGTTLLATNALLDSSAEITLQPAFRLHGSLSDPAGKSIADGHVLVQRPGGDRVYLRTDAEGHCQTYIGEPGMATLMVVRDGCTPYSRNVNLNPIMAAI